MHRRLFALLRDSQFAFGLTVVTGLLAGWLTIWQAWLLSRAVEGVFLKGQNLANVWPGLLLMLAIFIGRGVLIWLNEASAGNLAIRIKTGLLDRLVSHIVHLGPAFTQAQRTGELNAVAVEGIEALDAYFGQYLPQLLLAALVPTSILILVFPLDPLSGLILLLTAPLIPVFMYLIGKGAEALTRRQFETLGRLSAHFLDSLQGLTTLKIFGQSRDHTQTVREISDQYGDTTLSVLRVTFLSALVLELVATLSTAIIAVEIGLRLLYSGLGFQEALFLLILAPEFYLPLRMLGSRFHAGMAGTSAARRIYEILDTPITPCAGFIPATPKELCGPRTSISFQDLSFTYAGQAAPVLQNIQLNVPVGQHVALVGKTGAGKSTLIHLLLGFIQPTRGQILIDDQPLTDIDRRVWLKQVAWVPQNPHLFHDSLLANIRLGNPEAGLEQVMAAARAAHLHDFIQSLPQGYETVVGESGARLSGGEAQRLALARAFLKSAPVLILDEPTSNLDLENEAAIEESVRALMQGRTVLTIAHRLNTILHADQVILFDSGRLIDQGTHTELMDRNSLYARMIKPPGETGNREKVSTIHVPEKSRPSGQASFAPETHSKESPIQERNSPIFLRLLGFLQGSWGWIFLSVLLGALAIGSNIALLGSSAWLIATAALHPSIADLEIAIVGVRFFGLMRGISRYLERLVSHRVTFRLLARLRTWFYEKLEPLAPARLMEFHAGDLLARIVADVDTLEQFYVRIISPPMTATVIALGTASFLSFFDVRLSLLLIAFLLLAGGCLPPWTSRFGRRAETELVTRRAELHARLVDEIQGLADLLVFDEAQTQLELISKQSRIAGRTQQRLAFVAGFSSGMAHLLTHLGVWSVLVLSLALVQAGKLAGVMPAALALISLAAFESVTPLPLSALLWEGSRQAASRLFEMVSLQPATREASITRPRLNPSGASQPALKISNLTFTYPGQQAPALQDVSLSVPAGGCIAILGPSGAGKSTLLNLILRFWDYDEGKICLDGLSLKEQTQEETRRLISVLPQRSHFFNATIRQNLSLARPEATRAEIERAARKARIHEFIQTLPDGYETVIGEQGNRLSGGERQRLAIARAILKDAPILILDEPATHLDRLTEKGILETLFGLMHQKTSILVTHRLEGLENVDEILVMDHGRILERGTHNSLLQQDSLYLHLWNLQNSTLQED